MVHSHPDLNDDPPPLPGLTAEEHEDSDRPVSRRSSRTRGACGHVTPLLTPSICRFS